METFIYAQCSVISVYVPQCGLDESREDDFYDSLINIARKFGEKEIVVITGDFEAHENYEVLFVVHGYGARNKERKVILEFCATMNMAVENIFFKNRASHLVTYEPGPSETLVDYCLVRRNQKNFLKDL